jgi:hypothetical protein
MSPRLLRPLAPSGDSDVRAYIAAVEAADTQPLEQGVKDAYRDFVVGCKADGIWDAIKASCILMGARTLSGALTPLKGAAPTNVSNNFVSGDYNRETGLLGAFGKYIDSNRNRQDDPQDSSHIAAYISVPHPSVSGFARLFGCAETGAGRSRILRNSNDTEALLSHGRNSQATVNTGGLNVFTGLNRSSSASYDYRINGNTGTEADVSEARPNANWHIFNNNPISTAFLGRIAFYSIGESLSLSNLDSRISTLYAAIGAAI